MRNISLCPCLKVRVNFIPQRNYAAHFTVVNAHLAKCLNSFLNVKTLAGALDRAFSMKTDVSFAALV